MVREAATWIVLSSLCSAGRWSARTWARSSSIVVGLLLIQIGHMVCDSKVYSASNCKTNPGLCCDEMLGWSAHLPFWAAHNSK